MNNAINFRFENALGLKDMNSGVLDIIKTVLLGSCWGYLKWVPKKVNQEHNYYCLKSISRGNFAAFLPTKATLIRYVKVPIPTLSSSGSPPKKEKLRLKVFFSIKHDNSFLALKAHQLKWLNSWKSNFHSGKCETFRSCKSYAIITQYMLKKMACLYK